MAEAAETANGTSGLLPEGATGLSREISFIMFSVICVGSWKLLRFSLIIVSSFFNRLRARLRRLLTVFGDTPRNSLIDSHFISPR